MKKESAYIISLDGANNVSCKYDFKVDKSLFDAYEREEIIDASITVKALFVKTEGERKIEFAFNGSLSVPCDRCLEPVEVKIKKKTVVYLKTLDKQEEPEALDEDILGVPEGEKEIDVAHYIYETILLEKPMQCVHKKGQCNGEMIKKLNEENQPKSEEIDPRWEALKNIKLD